MVVSVFRSKLQKYVKKVMKYDWYYEGITTGLTNEELRKKIDDLSQSVYAREDVYFRKVNFVYAFFAEYLVYSLLNSEYNYVHYH